jgi:signal transduction histidine kinase/CheY-like chemotaxis protein
VASSDLATDPRVVHKSWAEAEGLRSSVTLPLICGDQVHGVLAVSTRVRHAFDAEAVELLWSFAAQAATALENARLFAELKRAYEELSRAQDELVRSEKLRALGQMAASIAHDLNNILAAILGQTDLLRLRAAGLPVHDALNRLELAATDAAEIVRRLQDFSRQQASQPLVPVDLAATVRDVLEITRPRWENDPQRRGVAIEVRLALPELPPVLGHAHEIREALTNLILNALDAMPEGGILAIGACERAAPSGPPKTRRPTPGDPQGDAVEGRAVELTVADTGVGMTAEVRQRIFDPFFTTKGAKGSGLGLSVVYGIMQRHGGAIDVASRRDRGTTFTLRFRVAAGPVVAPSPSAGGRALRPRRILLIDDDPTVRQAMAELLQEVGHSVVVAEGGAEGLAHLGQSRVDLVITDLGMPGMTGWEVARAVKLVTSHPPVMLLTGWGEHPASHSEHAGLVDRILGKPVRLDELLSAIRDLTRSTDEPGDALP